METEESQVLEAKRISEIQFRWGWVEPSVWTARMLEVTNHGLFSLAAAREEALSLHRR